MTKEEFENMGIGEKFTFRNNEFIVGKFWSCKDCDFNTFDINGIDCQKLREIGAIPKCQSFERKDAKDVCFKHIKTL